MKLETTFGSLNQKFIIENGSLIIGRCIFHKELSIDRSKVTGGGWYKIDNENKIIILLYSSHDFGQAKLEEIKECVDTGKFYDSHFSDISLTDMYKIDYSWYEEGSKK